MNPYAFVPLAGTPQRARPSGFQQYTGSSGEFRCRLTARTPLFMYDPRLARQAEPPAGPGHEVADFASDPSGQPMIWATALRGAIRGVAEAASRSCLSLFDGHYERWAVDYRPRLPGVFAHCDPGGPLCPSCRLFGAIGALQGGFAGSVTISNATTAGEATLTDYITVSAIQSPKPHHQAFYLTAEGEIAGRKFYVHQPNGPTATIERSRFTRTVRPLAAGSALTFTVSYRNLNDDDLRLLLYAIVLEPGLGHKLGMGKPVGLGSVTIDVQSARRLSAGDVALGRPGETLADEPLQEWVGDLAQPLRSASSPNLDALRSVLALDPGRPVAYPTADWFRSHPSAPLSDVPDVQPAPPAPRRAPERTPQYLPPDRDARFPGRPTPSPDRRGPPPERRPAAPRSAGRRPAFAPPGQGRSFTGEEPEYAEIDETQATAPAERPQEEPAAETRPATLEDLVRRFSRPAEGPPRAEPAPTRESQRARDEQRRLMERLRRREE